MRATSRLVIVWTGVTLVTVGVAWLGLMHAVDTTTTAPASVSALDPTKLKAGPKPRKPAPPTVGTHAGARRPTHSPVTGRKSRPGGAAQAPASHAPVSPTVTAHPTGSPGLPLPTTPQPVPSQPQLPDGPTAGPSGAPDEVIRSVRTDGGRATVAYSGGHVSLVDYTPAPGYQTQGFRKANDSIVVRFVGVDHVSSVYAYLDDTATFRAKVVEEDD